MSETKKELRWFSIMDYEKEARYLSRMHRFRHFRQADCFRH